MRRWIVAACVVTFGPVYVLGAPPRASQDLTASTDAAMRESALAVLDRAAGLFAIYAARSGGTFTIVTELTPRSIRSGRWKDGADLELTLANDQGSVIGSAHGRIGGATTATVLTLPVSGAAARASIRVHDDRGSAADWIRLPSAADTLVGDPLVYRSASRVAAHPAAAFEFARNESIRIEWPVLAPLETHEVHLLGRNGGTIPVDLPVTESADHKTLTLQMGLSGFGAGDYLIELAASSGAARNKKILAVRIK
jgi:hypothetical protein